MAVHPSRPDHLAEHPVDRPTSGVDGCALDRRSLLLAVPVAAFAGVQLAAEGVGDAFAGPFETLGTELGRDAVAWARSAGSGGSSPSRAALERAVLGAIGGRSPHVAVSLLDRRTGATWNYRGGALTRTGSVAKAMIVAAALRKARSAGKGLTATQREQARRAITVSDNPSADALYSWIGGHTGVRRLAQALGMRATAGAAPSGHWGTTLTTTDDLVVLMQALAGGHPALHATDRAYLLDLMARVVDWQRWGVGAPRSATVKVRNKNGWMAVGNPWVINSVGDVRGGGRSYSLAILQTRQPDERTGIARADRIGDAVFAAQKQQLAP